MEGQLFLFQVLTTTANGKEDFEFKNGESKLLDGVKVVYFNRKTKDHSHWSPSLLKHLYNNIQNYDIVHIHAWWNLVSMGAAVVCKFKGKQFILSPRGTLSNYTFGSKKNKFKLWFHQIVGKRLLKNTYFQVSTNKEANDILGLYKSPMITVLPNLIELSPTSYVRKDIVNYEIIRPLRLVFFSRIEKKKGLEFLIGALNETAINFTLDIYGVGEIEYINSLKMLVSKKILNKVNWNNPVFGVKKFEVLSSFDLLVLTSYDENFANVVIESLSVGTAVLLTKGVGLSDYVLGKKLGWICEQNIGSIKNILEQINVESAKLQKIKELSPNIIQQDFSEKVLIKKYIEYYQSI